MSHGRTPFGARAALLAVLLAFAPPAAGQWPQWRGPQRDGSVGIDPPPAEWPARLALLWEREVGEGYAGPIVAGGAVYVHSRRGEREFLTRLALADGSETWTRGYDAPFRQDPSAPGHGRGPYATPAVADGRVFTLGVKGLLVAWDAGRGDLLWRQDYSVGFDPPFMEFGAAASPLVWGGTCFVHYGGSKEGEPGHPRRGGMAALRVEDGREEWRWTGDRPPVGASPVVHAIAERPQLVFKTRKSIVGADPRTGRELWRVPFEVDMDNTIVTPLFVGDVLVTSDYQMGMHAWRIEWDGRAWSPRKLWRQRDASLFTSSPVLVAGQVVGFSELRKGQLVGVDPGDGRVLWRGEPRWGEHATLVAWGPHLLAFREDGSLVVGAVSPGGFRGLGTYRLGRRGTWAHPAVAGGRILVRDGSRLLAYRAGP